MMLIDMTSELKPLIDGMIALLVVSGLAVFAEPASRVVATWFRTLTGPRVGTRPSMGHSR